MVVASHSVVTTEASLLNHQIEAIDLMLRRDGVGGLFFEMGAGKTRAALEIVRRMNANRMLIIVPISVASVWKREVARWYLDNAPDVHILIEGTVRRRAEQLRNIQQGIVVVNYEAYWREHLRKAIIEWRPDAIVYDEAHRLKTRSSKQARFAHLLTDKVPVRLALTGTPMPNGPEDLYSMYKAIDPTVFGTRWPDFEAHYIKRGGYGGYSIIGYRNTEDLESRLQTSSYRITKAEALDLPEQIDIEIPVHLTNRTTYERMRRRAIAEVEGVSRSGGMTSGTAVARVALTNLIRLQQIASGFVKTVDGEIVILSHEKEDALADLLSDAMIGTSHAVVFCRFVHDVDTAMTRVGTHRLDGSIAPHLREGVLDDWRRDGGVLVVQVQVGSLGIDLTAAAIAVFYSLDYSLVNYLQARDRLHRIGQTQKVTYYHLAVENTVDQKVYAALEAKEDLARSLLDTSRITSLFS